VSCGAGSLEMTIVPMNAVSAGAQWSVNGVNWMNSGDIITDLVDGQYSVQFTNISGWNTPPNQTVTITGENQTTAAGVYTVQTGTLQVTITPTNAVTAGAQWSVDGVNWMNSGFITNLAVGQYTVQFAKISGWNTQSNQTVTITSGNLATTTCVYTVSTGGLQVTISPTNAVTAGAQWQVDSGAWQTNGASVFGLTVGSHQIEFKAISGWMTPADLQTNVIANQTTTAVGIYLLDLIKPTNSITSPTPGQSWSNGVFAVTGTASDNVAVSNVFYSLNNAAWTSATTANNWSNWTATVNLIAGTNTVQAYAVDTSGNVSTTNSVSFNAVLSTALTVSTNGLGSITTNYNGQLLIIGKSYSMTAKAATSFVFTNWTGGIGSPQNILTNGLTVNFLMQSNLWLQANFQETSKPTLTVSSPTNNKKLTNALANLIGTTSDNWKVDGVWNQLNDGAWNLASTTNSFTNWTATLTLIAGTNTIKSFAQNWGGLFSTTNNLSVISSNTFKLQLTFTNTLPLKTNGLVFTLQLSTGLVGHIQVSSNLTSWVALTNFTGTNGTLNFLDPAAASSSLRFYRAVIP